MKRTVLAVVLAMGAIGAPSLAAPSFAAGGGSLQTGSGVLFECAPHAYSYALNLPSDTESWSMDVTVRSQDGLEATGDFVYDVVGTSGTGEFQLCPTNGAGTYTMTAEVEYYDSDYNAGSFSVPAETFTMRFPKTRTTLSATVRKNQHTKRKVVVLRTRTTDERPNGYYGTSYPNVILQQKHGSSWRTVPNVDFRDGGDGRASARFTWPLGKKAVVRARTLARSYDDYTGSDSPTVRIR